MNYQIAFILPWLAIGQPPMLPGALIAAQSVESAWDWANQFTIEHVIQDCFPLLMESHR